MRHAKRTTWEATSFRSRMREALRRVGRRGGRVLAVSTVTAAVAASLVVVQPSAEAAVPGPSATESVITLKVAGDRTGSGFTDIGASPAGATFGLFTYTGSPTQVNNTWAVCTSDADGDCSFVVPETQVGGANYDVRFYVRQLTAPSGWFTNPQLRTGSASGVGTSTPYQFATPVQLRGGATYTSTADFMFVAQQSSTNTFSTASNGHWQQSRVNPVLSQQCGLDVALIVDLSTSVGSELPNLLGAADTFADSLVGTNSRMAVFSFNQLSPAATGANYPDLLPVGTQTQADAFKAQYAGWTVADATNTDRAFMAVAEASPHYDVAVMITDGNPSLYNDPLPVGASGNNTRFREVEYSIASANALKAEGTRIMAIGVGLNTSGAATARNLRAWTGGTAYNGSNALIADYYQAADYAAAGNVLAELASELCNPSLTVSKQVIPVGGTAADAAPAEGWDFTATADAGVVVDPGTQTTNASGDAGFDINFTAMTGAESTITLTETAQQYYELASVSCSVNGESVTPTIDTAAGTASLTVPAYAATDCTFTNQALPEPIDICTDSLYAINRSTTAPYGAVLRVNPANGSSTLVSNNTLIPNQFTSINGLAVSADGTTAWSVGGRGNYIKRVYATDLQTGVTTLVGQIDEAYSIPLMMGAYNPVDGYYYVGGYANNGDRFQFFAFDPATGTSLGKVAELVWPVPATNPDYPNGDIAFDSAGRMYVLSSMTESTSLPYTNELLVIDDVPTDGSLASARLLANIGDTSIAAQGIAFGANGYIYVQTAAPGTSNRQLIRFDPNSGARFGSAITLQNPGGGTNTLAVDLASCWLPSTATVQKDIVERAESTDQFTVTIGGNGISAGNTGTTSGTSTGLQTDAASTAGAVIAIAGRTYTVSESGAAGADLANYVTTWQCTESGGGTVISSGTGSSGSFTMPTVDHWGLNVACVFTNTALTQPDPVLIQILKVGEDTNGDIVPMDGSQWAIYDASTGGTALVDPLAGAASTGLFADDTLGAGTYWLEETHALDGFQLLAHRVEFTLSGSGAITLAGASSNVSVVDVDGVQTIRVEDVPALDLPDAGGSGTGVIYLFGGLLLAGGLSAAVLMTFRRKARHRVRRTK